MILPILLRGDPLLRLPAHPYEREDVLKPETRKLADDLVDTMLAAPHGVGLAAPQVGKRERMFVMRNKDGTCIALVNPVVLTMSTRRRHRMQEGCLSIPRSEWKGSPARAERCTVQFLGVDGKVHLATFTGLQAVIVQHEVDHLNGILFTDRCRPNVGSKHVLDHPDPFPIERRRVI